jgi:transcriptional regulator with XRE-family HTH domain
MKQVGENIKLARKRKKLTTIEVSERAGIDRKTLYQIEKGAPSVSIGAYFNVLRSLRLQVVDRDPYQRSERRRNEKARKGV